MTNGSNVRRPGQPMCYINGVMHGVVYMALVVYKSPSYLDASVATSTVGVYRQPLDDAHKKAVVGNWTIEHYIVILNVVHCLNGAHGQEISNVRGDSHTIYCQ